MTTNEQLLPAILKGWQTYQETLIKTIGTLDTAQLDLQVAPNQRTVAEILAHMIGARARWFWNLMGDGGEGFKALIEWGRGEPIRASAVDYVNGLVITWTRMQEIMNGWTEDDWEMTWPGKDEYDPKVITRQWVIWHLMEHDLHHGGEISLTLGSHGIQGVEL